MSFRVVFPEFYNGSEAGILADLRRMQNAADKNAEPPHSVLLVAALVEVPEADPGIVKAAFDGQRTAAGPFQPMKELGGPPGPEPTRFGDWEKKGRCIDF
jgi:hypothetical protein